MSFFGNKDFLLEVAKGNVPGHSIVHKFGHDEAIGTSFAPIAHSGVYPTPTAAVSLEFVSDSTADALDDTGAHEITIVGLDASWAEQEVVIAAHATDGLTAVAITGTWLRVYRAYVSKSGAYADAATGSHVGNITIRVSGAGATYGVIDATGFPNGQTEIGAYTVPTGYEAYILSVHLHVASAKNIDFLGFKREAADDVASSYDGIMRLFFQAHDVNADEDLNPKVPYDGFTGPCDIGFLAKVATGTGSAGVDFEILLVAN